MNEICTPCERKKYFESFPALNTNLSGYDQLSGIDWSKIWNFAKPILKTAVSFIPGVGGLISSGIDVVEDIATGATQSGQDAQIAVQARTSQAVASERQQGYTVDDNGALKEMIYQTILEVLHATGVVSDPAEIATAVDISLGEPVTTQATTQQATTQATSTSRAVSTGIPENAIVISKNSLRDGIGGVLNGVHDATLDMDIYSQFGNIRRIGGDTTTTTTTTPTTTTTTLPTNVDDILFKNKLDFTTSQPPTKTKLVCQVIGGEPLPNSLQEQMKVITELEDQLRNGLSLLREQTSFIQSNYPYYPTYFNSSTLPTTTTYDKETDEPITESTEIRDYIVPENAEISKVQFANYLETLPYGQVVYIRYDAPRVIFYDMIRLGYYAKSIDRFYPMGYDDDRWQIIQTANNNLMDVYVPQFAYWEN